MNDKQLHDKPLLLVIVTDKLSQDADSLAYSLWTRLGFARTSRMAMCVECVPEVAKAPAPKREFFLSVAMSLAQRNGFAEDIIEDSCLIRHFSIEHQYDISEKEHISGYISSFASRRDLGQGTVSYLSDANRARAKRAHRPLDGDDERVANELAALSKELDGLGYHSEMFKVGCGKVREIGEFLCSNGGSDRMDLICHRVAVMHGHSRNLERNWAGICGWLD